MFQTAERSHLRRLNPLNVNLSLTQRLEIVALSFNEDIESSIFSDRKTYFIDLVVVKSVKSPAHPWLC